jgi:tetratricopeptide (TPR) repeat protein
VVPFQPCTHFMSRPRYANKLTGFFTASLEYRQIFALWGLAGVGFVCTYIRIPALTQGRKTQIALEFAQSMKQRLSVFWVRADTLTNFMADYSQILEALEPNSAKPTEQDGSTSLLEKTRNRLEELSGDWLLILDNADHLDQFLGTSSESENSSSISQCVPRRGRILITTRDRRFQGTVAAASDGMCVDLMSEEEAEALLMKSIPQHLVKRQGANSFMAKELVEELGYLPLAIAQAAANIVDQQLSFAEYVRLFREKKGRMNLMQTPANDFATTDPRNAIQSVQVTWEISIDVLRKQSPLSVVFLRYLACFHWRDIPLVILQELPDFKELTIVEFLKVVKRPLGLSLIEQMEDDSGEFTTYSLHPFLHELMLKELDAAERWRHLEPAVALMSNLLPYNSDAKNDWALATFLSPHAARHVELAREIDCKSQPLALVMFRLSSIYGQTNMLKAGADIATSSVHMASELWGRDDTILFYFRKNSLDRLNDAARYLEAEKEAATLLKMLGEATLTQELGDIVVEKQRVSIQSSLAVALRGLRGERVDDLEAIHRAQLQSEHINPWSGHGIVIRHNLAHTLSKQRRFEEARAINAELLQFCETEAGIRVVGKRLHLIMLNLRATIIRNDGTLNELLEEVVQIYQRVFRESHDYHGITEVDTWISTNNLCGILMQFSRFNDAGPILWETISRAITAKIKTEGMFDRSVMQVYHKAEQYLGWVSAKKGEHSKEVQQFKELLEAWRFTGRLDEAIDRPDSQIDALNTLGVFKQQQGQYEEAEKYHKQALEINLAFCESKDMQGLLRYNIMLAIARSGRIEEAEAYRLKYLTLIAQSENNYGDLDTRMAEFRNDESIYFQAKEMATKGVLRVDDPWYRENFKVIQRGEARYGALKK